MRGKRRPPLYHPKSCYAGHSLGCCERLCHTPLAVPSCSQLASCTFFSITAEVGGREEVREALTFSDGGSQSVHEPWERLAGGRRDVQGGHSAAAQQVDLAGVLAKLLQIPGQQAELLTLRPAFLLQLPHLALRTETRTRG